MALWYPPVSRVAHVEIVLRCRSMSSRTMRRRVAYLARPGKDTEHGRRRFGVECAHVEPLVVFDRDGWRCQICGKATPKERRGSHYPNAPELDHRIPLSRGGSHTYDNVQCSCRRCNGLEKQQVLCRATPIAPGVPPSSNRSTGDVAGSCRQQGGGDPSPALSGTERPRSKRHSLSLRENVGERRGRAKHAMRRGSAEQADDPSGQPE